MHFPNVKPQVVSYRKYKDFHNKTFLDSLRHELDVQGHFLNEKVLDAFLTLFVQKCLISMLLKKRYIRYNDKTFINTEISKTTMTRSRLRNRFLKKLFFNQRNKCILLLRKSKKDYFENLIEKNITDNKRLENRQTLLVREKSSS